MIKGLEVRKRMPGSKNYQNYLSSPSKKWDKVKISRQVGRIGGAGAHQFIRSDYLRRLSWTLL